MMVAEQAQELAEKSAISVETQIEPDLLIHGDETMLMRMLLNLTENGIKYGRPGGHLRVRLSQTADSCVRGEIQDDGIGISPEHLPKIWDRFYQVNPARSSSDSGVGLGNRYTYSRRGPWRKHHRRKPGGRGHHLYLYTAPVDFCL